MDLHNLESGTTYYIRIAYKYFSEDEYSPFSDVLTVDTLPSAEAMGNPVQKKATKNSVTIQWKSAPGATSYEVYNNRNGVHVGTTTTNSITISKLTPATRYSFRMYPLRNGYGSVHIYKSVNTVTLPNAPENRLSVTGNFNSKKYYFGVVKKGAESGYEIEVYNKKKRIKKVSSTHDSVKLAKDKVYRFRARTYVTMNNAKKYSAWTSYKKLVVQNTHLKKKGRYLKVNWRKISGATRYNISVSKNKKNWKLFKKLGKNKTSTLITKYGNKRLKKNVRYYVLVTAYFGKQKNYTNVHRSKIIH